MKNHYHDFQTRKTILNCDNIKQIKKEIKNTTSEINDKKLEESLLNLGLSISNEEINE